MRAPTITDALLGEHGVIYALLGHLTSRPFRSAEEARTKAAELAAGLATHARIEDDLLFVALEGPLGPNGGPLAVMREEHAEVEGTLERLTRVDDVQEADALASHLASVAREHFAKEEQVLFPMAEQLLGEQVLRDLGEQWAAQRRGA
ncbi:MAG TPA: hemerythrin domain-containing protein [Gaiellaceae bacterium]|nr:hemerythrin domain-containing protein [Gaiellaceae bacterium]